MSEPALLTEWSRLLLGALAAAGVRDVVISPGSRNTPFTWAALRSPELRCRTVIDERSAAFFAVGHARMTGRPVLLICTSGSAAANYMPAVVEAAESEVPLLVLTADRPLELQQAAAPQTVDQVRMYGAFARAWFDLGVPDAAMLPALPRIAAQAVATTLGPLAGPVHLNARARKPLEPVEGTGERAGILGARVDELLARVPRVHASEAAPGRAAIEALAEASRGARRGLIVCGPELPWRAAARDRVMELAARTGFPVVAETASQQRFGPVQDPDPRLDAFEALLGIETFRERSQPDLILQIGRPPTASAWDAALKGWRGTRRWIIAPVGWPDPWGSATGILRCSPAAAITALTDALGRQGGGEDDEEERTEWRRTLREAGERAREVIAEDLDGSFSEGAAVGALVDGVPEGGILALGNSLPIREADLFVPPGGREVTVWSQRGANGIDGLVSGAAGAAAAGRPCTLILGDVSFAHDIGGLAVARELGVPLTIAVLNNGGGRIFERLPIAARLRDDPAFGAWLTPPRLDLAAAAATYGVRYARATDAETLREATGAARDAGSTSLVEVVVPPLGPVAHERDLLRRIEARLGP